MKERTYIAHVIHGNDNKDRYDAEVKKLLSDKTVLAWIMIYIMEEFKNCTVELSVLLSDVLRPEEKEEILEKEYDMETSVELKGGLERMCNLSDMIEERGIARGIEQGIEQTLFSLVRQGLLKTMDAAKQLNISEEDFVTKMERAK